jgi:hypothetical protein
MGIRISGGGGGISTVLTDTTLTGDGSIVSPLSVVDDGHDHVLLNITDAGTAAAAATTDFAAATHDHTLSAITDAGTAAAAATTDFAAATHDHTLSAITDAGTAAAAAVGDFEPSTHSSLTQTHGVTLGAIGNVSGPATHADARIPVWSGASTRTLAEGVEILELYVSAPATPTSTGTKGQMAYSANYIYFCVDTNVWVRTSAESTWS